MNVPELRIKNMKFELPVSLDIKFDDLVFILRQSFLLYGTKSDCMAFLLTQKRLKTHVEWCQILYELGLILVNLLSPTKLPKVQSLITHLDLDLLVLTYQHIVDLRMLEPVF